MDERITNLDLSELLELRGGRAHGPATLRRVVDGLADVLGATTLAYRPELTAQGWATEQMVHSGDARAAHLAQLATSYFPQAPLRYGHYDALLVEADQRNRLVGDREFRAMLASGESPVVRSVYRPSGVLPLGHARVVISDGPFMLCWLGLWREEPFSAEEEASVASIVPALGDHLAAERLLWGGTPGSFDAVSQTLELVARPAFVMNAAGQLAFVNAAARALIDRDRAVLDDVTDAAVRGIASPRVHSITRVASAGAQSHFIVLTTEEEESVDARLAAVVRDHRLTATQARVLALLVRGDANKDIATKLRCAPRTVELHVTAVLKKCGADSRTRLIAWFWTRH
ncbi:MAG: LuxR family transcriptional regulator [Labilithrix sp.]|nr:LuxR family transcriptional regulator [Labilithrix sp.]